MIFHNFKKGEPISRDLQFQIKHFHSCFSAHVKSHLRFFSTVQENFANKSRQTEKCRHHPENATKRIKQRKIFSSQFSVSIFYTHISSKELLKMRPSIKLPVCAESSSLRNALSLSGIGECSQSHSLCICVCLFKPITRYHLP